MASTTFAGGTIIVSDWLNDVNTAVYGVWAHNGPIGTESPSTGSFTSVTAAGNISSTLGTIGYATGAGGTVTQATSRTTGVTLNKPSGAITLFSAAGTTAYTSFTVTNSYVSPTDTVVVCQKSGTDLYEVFVTAVGAGTFRVSFATTGGTTVEQPVFNFNVIKGAVA
jgi:hypothetical protein